MRNNLCLKDSAVMIERNVPCALDPLEPGGVIGCACVHNLGSLAEFDAGEGKGMTRQGPTHRGWRSTIWTSDRESVVTLGHVLGGRRRVTRAVLERLCVGSAGETEQHERGCGLRNETSR